MDPTGKQKKEERPPTGWRDELAKDIGLFWHRTALHRKRWKWRGGPYARRWPEPPVQ